SSPRSSVSPAVLEAGSISGAAEAPLEETSRMLPPQSARSPHGISSVTFGTGASYATLLRARVPLVPSGALRSNDSELEQNDVAQGGVDRTIDAGLAPMGGE